MKQGWISLSINDLVEPIETWNPRKNEDALFTYIDVSSVCRKTMKVATPTAVKEKDAPSRARRVVRSGDVIFATIRPTLKRVAVIPPELDRAICSTGFFVLRPKENILSRYFFYWLLGDEFSKAMQQKQRGASYPAVSDGDVKEQMVTVPTLAEQQHIIGILDEAFEGIDNALANTEKNLANARELFACYLSSIFQRKGSGWRDRKLGDNSVLEVIDGDRGKNYPKKTDFLDDGFCLFMNTKNVRPNGLRFDELMFITEEKDSALGKGKLKRRDVILTTRGTVGNVGIYDEGVEYENVRINSGMLILRPNESVVTSEFLFELLRSSSFKNQVSKHVSGAAQPQLPIKTLINFDLPIPDEIEEQAKLVESLRELEVETNRLESIYKKKLTALTDLKQSLLQKAFNGELTGNSGTSDTIAEETDFA